jgi:hypothetical protein
VMLGTGEAFELVPVPPRHPGGRVCADVVGVPEDCDEVVEEVDALGVAPMGTGPEERDRRMTSAAHREPAEGRGARVGHQ